MGHDRKLINEQQTAAAKLEVLRAYFDFRDGRPTAEMVSERTGIPIWTVREWLSDNENARLLDDVVPLWPMQGGARQYAADHVPEALQTIVDIMRSASSARDRLVAARTLLGLAGIQPNQGQAQEEGAVATEKKAPVLLNLFVGGLGSPQRAVPLVVTEDIIEAEVRETGLPAPLPAPGSREE